MHKRKEKKSSFSLFFQIFLSFSIFFRNESISFVFGALFQKQIVETKQTKIDLDTFLFNKRSTMGQLLFNLLFKNLISKHFEIIQATNSFIK